MEGVKYRQLTLSINGRGARLRQEVDGSEIRSLGQFRVRAKDLIVSKIDARKGAAAVVPDELDGAVVSADFPTFAIDTSVVLPEFLDILVRHPSFAELADTISAGTTNRVRMDLPRFPKLVLTLPPLFEQRRIVDLVRSIDAAVDAAAASVSAAESAKSASMLTVLRETAGQSLPVVNVLSTVVGGVWGEPPGERSMDVSALGLVAFNVTDHQVDPSLGTPRSLDPGTADSRSLVRHDIVLERSGGTKDRPVGRVITAPKDMPSVVPTDFMRLLRVDARRAEPRYVYWWLWGCYERGDTIPFQTQTTNIRNLRVKDYLNEPIRLPDREHQQRVVGTMDAFSEVTNRGRAVVEALIRLRAGLLDDLLSGRHRVPSSYDRFLDSAA